MNSIIKHSININANFNPPTYCATPGVVYNPIQNPSEDKHFLKCRSHTMNHLICVLTDAWIAN